MTDKTTGNSLDFRKTKFITSAPDISKLPQDLGAEIAIVGRSNSGKSSAINAICDNKNLAKTSQTPGRTRLINIFEISKERYLVDLPGYGYAKVSESIKRQWQNAMTEYLQQRKSLIGLVLTMDIRNPLKDHDRILINWSLASNLPVLILLTKADKFGVNKSREIIGEVRTMLSEYGSNFNIVAFSAVKKTGVNEVRVILNEWLSLAHTTSEDNLKK
jgi:GTP-binding protein